MENTATRYVAARRLRFSRAPAGMIAGAALDAARAAGIPDGDADLVVIACPKGTAAAVERAAIDAVTALDPRPTA